MQLVIQEDVRRRTEWEELICQGLQDVDFLAIIENHPNDVLGEVKTYR